MRGLWWALGGCQWSSSPTEGLAGPFLCPPRQVCQPRSGLGAALCNHCLVLKGRSGPDAELRAVRTAAAAQAWESQPGLLTAGPADCRAGPGSYFSHQGTVEANEGPSPSEEEQLGVGGLHLTWAWKAWSPQPAHVAMQCCARHTVCDIMGNVLPKGLKDFPKDRSRTKPGLMSSESPAPQPWWCACRRRLGVAHKAACSWVTSRLRMVGAGNHLWPCQQPFCTQHK